MDILRYFIMDIIYDYRWKNNMATDLKTEKEVV